MCVCIGIVDSLVLSMLIIISSQLLMASLYPMGVRFWAMFLICIARINDPMHVRCLLFCVCWVWYYTYFVEYYSFTYAMLLVYSIVPCPAVSRIFYGI